MVTLKKGRWERRGDTGLLKTNTASGHSRPPTNVPARVKWHYSERESDILPHAAPNPPFPFRRNRLTLVGSNLREPALTR